MPKTKQKQQHKACIKIFAPWQKHKEEAWLSSLSEKGWHLKEIRGRAGFLFEHGPAAKRQFALVFSKHGEKEAPDWEMVARNGNYTYYAADSAQAEGLPRPAFGDEEERILLQSMRTNLMTGLLLNVPGVLLCLFFISMFFSGGFLWADLFQSSGLWYFVFLLLGFFSIYTFSRWVFQTNRCLKRLLPQNKENWLYTKIQKPRN